MRKEQAGQLLYPFNPEYAVTFEVLPKEDYTGFALSMRSAGNKAVDFTSAKGEAQDAAKFFLDAFESVKNDWCKYVGGRQASGPQPHAHIKADNVSVEISQYRSDVYDYAQGVKGVVGRLQDQQKVFERLFELRQNPETGEKRRYSHAVSMDTDNGAKIVFNIEAGDAGLSRRITVRADIVSDGMHEPDIDQIREKYSAVVDTIIKEMQEKLGAGFPCSRDEYAGWSWNASDFEKQYLLPSFAIFAKGEYSNFGSEEERDTPGFRKKFGNSDATLAMCNWTFPHNQLESESRIVAGIARELAGKYGAQYEQKKTSAPVVDAQLVADCHERLSAAIDQYAAARSNDYTAQFLQQYFHGAQLEERPGNPQEHAIARIEGLSRRLIAYKGEAADSSLLSETGVANTLAPFVENAREQRLIQEQQSAHPVGDVMVALEGAQNKIEKLPDTLSRRAMLAAALKVGALALAIGHENNAPDAARDVFIEECTAIAGTDRRNAKKEFGALYDKLQLPAAKTKSFATGLTAGAVIDHLAGRADYNEKFVDGLAEALRPRIDAIVEWNASLPPLGFVEMNNSRARSKKATVVRQ